MTDVLAEDTRAPSRGAADGFAAQIEAFFGQGRCFLLAKGRVGLYAGLRAMNLPRDAGVVMPGYTCMVVPSAVQLAGLKPVYVDIHPETYNLDPALLDAERHDDVAAIIVQHTYGIPCEMEPIESWAQARGVPIIEDCCHTFGVRYGGRLCGTLGAFSFMSGQWNKPFSTGLGGILLVNDAGLAEAVERLVRAEAVSPGRFRNLVLKLQILAHQALVRPSTAGLVMRLYRWLTRRGLAIGSSTRGELVGEVPRSYFATMAPCQVRRGLREMVRIDENIRHRRQRTAYYHQRLSQLGFAPLGVPEAEELPLLRYPVRVANKEEVLRRAERAGVEIGSWFEVPLHPAGTRMEDYGYREGCCPHAETAARQAVNLPTHLKVDPSTADRTLDFLAKHARPA